MNLLELARKNSCKCGKSHYVELNRIIIRKNALNALKELIPEIMIQSGQNLNPKCSVLMICDQNTYTIAGKYVEIVFSEIKYHLNTCILISEHAIIPNEQALKSIDYHVNNNTRLFLAVGSGTINDLTRFIANKFELPFISIPTAPSVDGFTSSVASLILNNVKTTLPAKSPNAIVVDINILTNSPDRMKRAGFGDLLGKFTARMDWHLGNIINNEDFCVYTADLVQDAVQRCILAFNHENSYREPMVKTLIEGLLISGLAISMMGNSRPASGSEHHISHFLEQKALMGATSHYLHGETVSVGTCIMARLYSLIFGMTFRDFKKLVVSKPARDSNQERIERLKEAYGTQSLIFVSRWKSRPSNNQRITDILSSLSHNWNYLVSLKVKFIGPPGNIENLMKDSNISYSPKILGYSRSIIENAIICSKEIRQRYTLLTLLDELGVLEYFCRVVNAPTYS